MLVLASFALGGFTRAEAGSPTPPLPEALLGDWYVLVHYTDASGEEPKLVQWDEAVWRFASEGERLRWTIFTRLQFKSAVGRFETLPGGRTARSLGAWTPDTLQLEEIARGLRVSGEGSLGKTLRGSREAGYRSAGRMRADSASVIGYTEQWTIEIEHDLPVFTRDATMSAARVEAAAGRTRFRGLELRTDGRELRGAYVRDVTQTGDFRMIRTGELALDRRR